MSQKFVDPNALNENVIKTKQHVEAVRSALDSAKQNVIQFTTMPVPDATWNDKVVQYTGTTTQNYTKGYFYSCEEVPDTDPTEYRWTRQDVMKPIDADGTTVAYDQVTGVLSAIPATNSTKGIVQHGDGTEIGSDGQVNVVDRLVVTATLPTADDTLVGAVRLYVGSSGTYELGGIYQCQETSTDVYEWVLISMADVDLSAYQKTFLGTTAEWNAKTTAQKIEYDEADITDDLGGGMVVSTVPAQGDHNPIESEAVYNLEQDVEANSDAIADIFNKYGSKNLLPNTGGTNSSLGITYAYCNDGSVRVSGTANGNSESLIHRFTIDDEINTIGNEIIFSGALSGTSASTCYLYFNTQYRSTKAYANSYKIANGEEYRYTVDDTEFITAIYVAVTSGTSVSNLYVYPMFRYASVEDNTYEPYAPTNLETLGSDANAELGAHQFIDYDLASLKARNTNGTWNGNDYTLNGVTFTVNDDLSISATGQATTQTEFYVHNVNLLSGSLLKKDTAYIASMSTKKGSESSFKMVFYGKNASSQITFDIVTIDCDGCRFKHSQDSYYFNFAIRIMSGYNPNGMTFYPLIRFASDPSTKFTLYAKSNRELTEGEIYSTTERIVGKWIDGKTLYRKVIQATLPTVTTAGTEAILSVNTGVTGLSQIIDMRGFFNDVSNLNTHIYSARSNNSTDNHVQICYDKENNQIKLISSALWASAMTTHIIIEYTKS